MLRDPFSTLPCEIASEIFVHCLPTSYTDREWNTANPREAPMLLLHVCRIWREIAIGTPALWAKMELSMHNAHCHDTALACLKRAKACPLAVKLHHWARGEIDEEDTWSDKEDEYSWLISPFQTLLGCAHNLKFLELSAIPLGYMRELDRLSGSCNFPLLQKLAIGVEAEVWSDESEGELRPCVQLFANAPLLCELSLIGDTPPVFLGSLPWNQLTKYTGTTNHLDLCIEALRLGTNLVECALAANGIDGDFVGILIHSSLKSLTFFSHEWWCSTDILRFLTLPALESLRILDCPNEWFQYREFLEFLTRSSPPLRQFAIRLDPRTALSVDIVLAMSGLVELEIWNPHDTFFTAFFSYFDAVAVLPQLQHLSFFHPHHSSKSVASKQLEEVQGGLTARWNANHEGVVQLKSFCLEWARDVGDLPEDTLVLLRAMASEGLKISISSPTRSYI